MFPAPALAVDGESGTDNYTIDFKAETITAADGYVLAATDSASDGSKSLEVTPGTDVYIRPTSEENSEWKEVDIPDRPSAPSISSMVLDYEDETLAIT